MDDQELVQLALALGIVTDRQVSECRALRRDGGSLTAVLIQRGYLQPGALDRLSAEVEQVTRKPSSSALPSTALAAVSKTPPEVEEARKDPRFVRGKYVLLRELGRGGMGTVWLAWQTDLMRYAAIKYLMSTTPEDLARFQREAQTAGRLSHPNIVAVHEVGTHFADGTDRPYIAMEFIDGGTLSDSVRKRQARIRDHVAVIKAAAEAVHYAHSKGVVHRDMKPQNILIAKDGRVFVTDFGLARVIGSASSLSATGALMGTPDYMSPEQASGQTRTIGAKSDVYSLGATLYFVLTGKPPFSGANAGETLAKVIWDDPTSPRQRNREVPGDLETICLRAMEKEPERRYESAGAMAIDLGRWLEGEAIHARPASWTTMVWRRVRKHRMAATLAAVLAVVLPVGVWMAVALGTRGAEERARRERRQAAMADFEAGREAYETAFKRSLTSKTLEPLLEPLVEALRRLSRAAKADPDFVDAHELLGHAFALNGDSVRAEEAYTRALELDPDRTTALLERGKIRIWTCITSTTNSHGYFVQGRWRETRQEVAGLEERIAAARQDFERAARRRGSSREVRCAEALLAHLMDDRERAVELLREVVRSNDTDPVLSFALAYAELKMGNLQDAADGVSNVLRYRPWSWRAQLLAAFILGVNDQHEEALDRIDRALAIKPDAGGAREQRALALVRLHRYAEAERTLEGLSGESAALLDVRAKLAVALSRPEEAERDLTALLALSPNVPDVWCDRADVRVLLGKLDGAERDIEQALKLDPEHPHGFLARACLKLARVDPKGALADVERALAIDDKGLTAHTTHGRVLHDLVRREEALAAYGRALKIDPRAAATLNDRAQVHGEMGRPDLALADLDRALSVNDRVGEIHFNRSRVLRKLGRVEEANAAVQRAVEFSPKLVRALVDWAHVLQDQERDEECLTVTDRVLEIEPRNAEAWAYRGGAFASLGRLKEALASWRKAVEIDATWEKELGPHIRRVEEGLRKRGDK